MSHPRRRGAVILATLGALLVLTGIGVFMLNRSMRQVFQDSHRYTWNEIATNLAQSGINVGWEHLVKASATPGSALHAALVGNAAAAANGVRVPIESPHLEDLAALLGDDVEVEVALELRDFVPLLTGPAAGVRLDKREKLGELALVSRARYRGATRTLVARRQVRVIGTTLPVLSKFTLFVRRNTGRDPNILAYDRKKPGEGFRFDGQPARPLLLYHRRTRFPAVLDGKLAPLADSLATLHPDDGGLVFLGGDPWELNLVHGPGAGPYEELFQVRRSRYSHPTSLPGAKVEIGLTFGFYDGIFESDRWGTFRREDGTLDRGALGTLGDGTSGLHLFGEIGSVSPTVVLGRARRRYVEMRLLDGDWFPARTPSEFAAWKGSEAFGGNFRSYERFMPRVVTEPFNRAWDYMATNSEVLGEDLRVEGSGTPAVPRARLVPGFLKRVRPLDGEDHSFLYREGPRDGSGCELVKIGGQKRPEVIFRGHLQDIAGDLVRRVVSARAVQKVPNAEAFRRRFVRGRHLVASGTILIQDGGLELGNLVSASACVIAAPGEIAITGPLLQKSARQPLTLASLGGDIVVRTPGKIDAHLVALEGTLRAQGPIRVVGGVAVDRLELAGLVRGEEVRSITYNQDLDPTDHETADQALRVYLNPTVSIHSE